MMMFLCFYAHNPQRRMATRRPIEITINSVVLSAIFLIFSILYCNNVVSAKTTMSMITDPREKNVTEFIGKFTPGLTTNSFNKISTNSDRLEQLFASINVRNNEAKNRTGFITTRRKMKKLSAVKYDYKYVKSRILAYFATSLEARENSGQTSTANTLTFRKLEDVSDDNQRAYESDDNSNKDDDMVENTKKYGYNELCSSFLVSFLEGTTDARDTCEGIMNAYMAAGCSAKSKSSSAYKDKGGGENDDEYDFDDYFAEFTEHQCCQALQSHHSEYCDEDTLLTNFHLFVGAAVLLLCECAKAAVVYYDIHFLPEAGVCILVGCLVGSLFDLFSQFLPMHVSNIDDLSFDDDLFLSLLLPPIIFEAALSVSKYEFKRRRGAIFMFSVFGTVISTFSTGLMVHYISMAMKNSQTFPMLDSLVFGSLISSIDPVAILSVLTHLNLDQRDTIFILVFGESLLNDGIAITVFQTLVNRFDGKTTDHTTSLDEILEAVATFMIAMFGSIVVGIATGCGAYVYFNVLGNLLPPVMEVGSFFLFALIPYYICDGVGWSGIVSIVAVGFFMDVYIAGPKSILQHSIDATSPVATQSVSPTSRVGIGRVASSPRVMADQTLMVSGYHGMNDTGAIYEERSIDSIQTSRSFGPLPSTERINMSATADKHVRFVAHLTSQLAENAIFSYIGLFLFSNNYDWNPTLVAIAVSSCILSRVLMVGVVSFMIFHIYKFRGISATGHNSSRTAAAIQNPRTQAVLVLAGLRGAVSLALVENVPIYNSVTGEGCEFKQLMKGMTSACILFTTFVFGGGAYYILPKLGITQDHSPSPLSINPQSSNQNEKTHPII